MRLRERERERAEEGGAAMPGPGCGLCGADAIMWREEQRTVWGCAQSRTRTLTHTDRVHTHTVKYTFVREKGAFFDSVMYELLQRQIQKSKT